MIVYSVTNSGRRFRPSDWIQRLTGLMSTFDESKRLKYNEMLRPVCDITGVCCMHVSVDLKKTCPELYKHVMRFVADNDLQVNHDG